MRRGEIRKAFGPPLPLCRRWPPKCPSVNIESSGYYLRQERSWPLINKLAFREPVPRNKGSTRLGSTTRLTYFIHFLSGACLRSFWYLIPFICNLWNGSFFSLSNLTIRKEGGSAGARSPIDSYSFPNYLTNEGGIRMRRKRSTKQSLFSSGCPQIFHSWGGEEGRKHKP